jgi:RNA polymerase sigma factor (TIGR02999 family)
MTSLGESIVAQLQRRAMGMDRRRRDRLDRLVALAYDELRAIAHRHLVARGAHDGGATLDTTALVHEAYLRLVATRPGSWHDQAHFRAVASVAMRHILIDRARAHASNKRGAGCLHVALDAEAIAADDAPDVLLAIDSALDRLAELSPRLARVVELRFYGGFSDGETAVALGVTVRTVQRDWTKARMLLERLMRA